MPSIELIGVYQVEFTKELFEKAWEMKYGGTNLSQKQEQEARQYVQEELSSIVLIEVIVKKPDDSFDIGDFLQTNSDQTAYDEAFLTLDGSNVISRFQQPNDTELRIAFFLHFFDPAHPISTSYGELYVNEIKEMPARLADLIPYEPID